MCYIFSTIYYRNAYDGMKVDCKKIEFGRRKTFYQSMKSLINKFGLSNLDLRENRSQWGWTLRDTFSKQS